MKNRYRIKIETLKDESQLFYPQIKKFFGWSIIKHLVFDVGCYKYIAACDSKKDAIEVIQEHDCHINAKKNKVEFEYYDVITGIYGYEEQTMKRNYNNL